MPVKNIIPGQRVTKEKLQRAKELRREMTPATPSAPIGAPPPNPTRENLYTDSNWHRRIWGRQEGVVEVDGDIHDLQQEEDARRKKVLSKLGLRIVRFRNDEVVRELSAVVEKSKDFISISK